MSMGLPDNQGCGWEGRLAHNDRQLLGRPAVNLLPVQPQTEKYFFEEKKQAFVQLLLIRHWSYNNCIYYTSAEELPFSKIQFC
jgi:hypothetical protein